MDKLHHRSAWLEQGYLLFAADGPDGVQIERIARILQLNKSGFYHYFGDMEGYYTDLLQLHKLKTEAYLNEIRDLQSIDPEFFHLVVRFKVSTVFHVQLIRCSNNPVFYNLAKALDQKEEILVRHLWSEYLGFQENPDLAMRYFIMIRDMFYTRASLQNITYEFLRDLTGEAKDVVNQLTESNTTQAEEAF
jgi:AcrR family transcriptional regulator